MGGGQVKTLKNHQHFTFFLAIWIQNRDCKSVRPRLNIKYYTLSKKGKNYIFTLISIHPYHQLDVLGALLVVPNMNKRGRQFPVLKGDVCSNSGEVWDWQSEWTAVRDRERDSEALWTTIFTISAVTRILMSFFLRGNEGSPCRG